MNGNLWHVIVVALFLAILLPAVNLGYQDATQTAAVENETATVDYDTPSTLNPGVNAVSYHDNETIVTAGGQTLSEGVDYQWNTSTGEISWLNSTNTEDGETAYVSYAVDYRSETTTDIAGFLTPWGTILGVFLLVTALGYFVNMAFGGGGW